MRAHAVALHGQCHAWQAHVVNGAHIELHVQCPCTASCMQQGPVQSPSSALPLQQSPVPWLSVRHCRWERPKLTAWLQVLFDLHGLVHPSRNSPIGFPPHTWPRPHTWPLYPPPGPAPPRSCTPSCQRAHPRNWSWTAALQMSCSRLTSTLGEGGEPLVGEGDSRLPAAWGHRRAARM